MKFTRSFGCAVCSVLIAGCVSPTEEDAPQFASTTFTPQYQSGFAPLDATNAIDVVLKDRIDGGYSDANGRGFAYAVGIASDGTYSAYSALLPQTTVTAMPAGASATYTGAYEYVDIDYATSNGSNSRSATATRDAGTLRLTANLGTNQITGTGVSAGSGGTLSMNASYDQNQTISGTVFAGSNSGTVTGKIGGDHAVGAFHGSNVFGAFSGGFYTTKTP